MYSREVTVMNASGLHARPASNLVQYCAKFPCRLTL
ncbi:MAG: HPr family phosphocarrier protein, partial [Oscillospiraceae bacterium]|nr:HPr family phosphocarrier protein [Oscillospiraceae bacterium]